MANLLQCIFLTSLLKDLIPKGLKKMFFKVSSDLCRLAKADITTFCPFLKSFHKPSNVVYLKPADLIRVCLAVHVYCLGY